MPDMDFTCTVNTKVVREMRIAMLRITDRLDEVAIVAHAAGSHVDADRYSNDDLFAIFGLLRRCAKEARAEIGKIETLSRKLSPLDRTLHVVAK